MEFPFFSLQKPRLMDPIEYEDDEVQIRVSPGERGVATIWDKDVLIYVASLINDRIERGLPVSRTVHFPAHDLLKLTHRGTGKQAYELLKDALFRLRSTTITTTIKSGGETKDRGFGWIDSFEIVRRERADGKMVMQAVEVTLNDWMFKAIVKDRRVLTISPSYFEIDGGLERRVYELARKHCGHQDEWRIGLERLAKKCGARSELRFFKRDVLKIIERGSLPDYTIQMEQDIGRGRAGRITVVFEPRTKREQSTDSGTGREHSTESRALPALEREQSTDSTAKPKRRNVSKTPKRTAKTATGTR
ncbi:RepB family plasmid replication initiator protein [Roseomonas genomospecies 6]|uniref:RepB family plasmid replication initiator protein n=2 Tax=Roseomonas genomospecies 6 TaxID=214106 RepID=A0A9W7NFB8_9PROT|nr:RepB family plasmid replication initiator protein [Roseomonas genomospecies 6]